MATVIPNGNEVKCCRERLELRQEDLADKAPCSKKTLERIESGKPTTMPTLRKIATVLRVDVRDLLTIVAAKTTVWLIGSYTDQTEQQRKLTEAMLPILANGLVRLGVRVVMGESTMLQELAHACRDAMMASEKSLPLPIMLFGKLRQTDVREVFATSINVVPDLAIVIGGGVARGRIQEECVAATAARIPILTIAATGAAASQLESTADLVTEDAASVIKNVGSSDAGDLAKAVIQAVRCYHTH